MNRMNRIDQKREALIAIRWVLRGIIGLFVAFMVFMVAGYALEDGYLLPDGKEAIPFLFAPIGYTVGLVIAIKWEGVGGLINVISVIGWHIAMGAVNGDPRVGSAIDIAGIPGLLFVLLWLAFRKLSREKRAENSYLSPIPAGEDKR